MWNLVQDLLGKDVPREHRHLTLNFLKCLVQGQYSKLSSLMRVKFFMVVKEYDIPEDIGPRYFDKQYPLLYFNHHCFVYHFFDILDWNCYKH